MSKKFFTWTPRVLSILLVLLLLIISFDVFEEDDLWYMILLGFLIHNIPVIVLIATIITSWKRPFVGSMAFLAIGLFYTLYMLINHGSHAMTSVLSLGLPAMIISCFYAFDSCLRKKGL
jgi:hypothetical protein